MTGYRWLNRLLSPRLDWIQVEVTSFCNASCIYCPHTTFRETWSSRHLSIETFEKILGAAWRTNLVYLQGWGEPFLNPDFFAMAALAKRAGSLVGVTTNGMLCNDEIISNLVEEQIDIVAFSLAGADEMNDTVRKGTHLETVLTAIRNLNHKKEAAGSSRPAIHIAYLLLRSALDGLGKLPCLLENTGVTQIVISTLDFVPTKELEGEVLAPSTVTEYEALQARLDEVAAEARRMSIGIHYQIRYPGERRPVCTENVLRAVFISAEGDVSPCVYTNMPVVNAVHVIDGTARPLEHITFGNVNECSLSRIWRTRAYAAFRRCHVGDRVSAYCRECPKLYIG